MKRDLRIFVVDDMPNTAHTLAEVLRDRGYIAIPYTDAWRALREARSLLPQVLISDVEMPSLCGVELAIELLKFRPECKVLLMSGHVGPIACLERARAKGFNCCFYEKPVACSVLIQELGALLGHY